MKIERCSIAARHDLVRLRRMLWPESTTQDHLSELTDRFHAGESGMAVFIARTDAGEAAGFAEATLRHDPVNGCNTSPVLFLEGIFVLPDHRRRGVAKSLCEAVEAWGDLSDARSLVRMRCLKTRMVRLSTLRSGSRNANGLSSFVKLCNQTSWCFCEQHVQRPRLHAGQPAPRHPRSRRSKLRSDAIRAAYRLLHARIVTLPHVAAACE